MKLILSIAFLAILTIFFATISVAQDFKEPDLDEAMEQCDNADGSPDPEPVPFYDEDGNPNLALLKTATPNASSLLAGWCPQRHCVEYLNDGFYNNCRSWIPASLPAWAEIDLGGVYPVHKVAFGSEHTAHYGDRAVTEFRILVTTNYDEDSNAATWEEVFDYKGEAVRDTTPFTFDLVEAGWVRIDIIASDGAEPRIDEIEIYGTLAVKPAGKLSTTWAKIKVNR